MQATSQLSQTTLRSVLGKHDLDEMLAERDKLNNDIQEILDSETDAWGIKVSNVEIKHVDLDESMIRAIARQAEAERERRAKVINAEGEQQAAQKLLEAAEILVPAPRGDAAALPQHAQHFRQPEQLHRRISVPDGTQQVPGPVHRRWRTVPEQLRRRLDPVSGAPRSPASRVRGSRPAASPGTSTVSWASASRGAG